MSGYCLMGFHGDCSDTYEKTGVCPCECHGTVLHVTRAQVAAAQLRVALDQRAGRELDPTIVAIAEALQEATR